MLLSYGGTITQKVDPPFLVPPVQIYKIFGPLDNVFQFGDPQNKNLIYLGPFEIFYPI